MTNLVTMKRVVIIAYPGVAAAFAAAAIQKLIDSGADVQAMTAEELSERAIELAPVDFPIYECRTAPEKPRFNGYMKRAGRHR